MRNKQKRGIDMNVLLVPTWELAKQTLVHASVEMEYGTKVKEGLKVTLAHHVEKYKKELPPCVREVEVLTKGSTIGISHLDLDTVGGVLALMGKKPMDSAFWEVAGFIDENGPHHLHKYSQKIQDQLNAYWAWSSTNMPGYDKKIQDVTSLVLKHSEALHRIIEREPIIIKRGREWREKLTMRVERALSYEDDLMRVFISNGVKCTSCYYSEVMKKSVPLILEYNTHKKKITVSSNDKRFDAEQLLKSVFGDESGGKKNGSGSIAGTPRNKVMNHKDFNRLVQYVEQTLYIKQIAN